MDTKELERIERYLSQQMVAEESILFEKELKESKDLADRTKKIAYIIYSTNAIGLKKDNERLNKINISIPNDRKRFTVSIAAMLTVVLTFAAVASIPAYQYVVRPIIKKVTSKKLPSSTITESVATEPVEVPQETEVVTEKEIVQEQPSELFVEVPEVSLIHETEVIKKENNTSVPIVSKEDKLLNFSFSQVETYREKDKVLCTFTMTNEIENTEIQMHSARAKDNTGKSYAAKSCLLNGKIKRISKKWEKGVAYPIEITILDVPTEVTGIAEISFSFQSSGDSLRQKSRSIILKAGEIK